MIVASLPVRVRSLTKRPYARFSTAKHPTSSGCSRWDSRYSAEISLDSAAEEVNAPQMLFPSHSVSSEVEAYSRRPADVRPVQLCYVAR
jgi:hypothetical protein